MSDFVHEMFGLEGKKAIVTGAAQGLGRGMAEALIAAGATVALVGRTDTVRETCREIDPDGVRALPFVADLGKREELDRVFDEILSAFDGRLDILVNNAGITRRHPPEAYPREDWDAVVAVNLDAVWLMCQRAGQIMIPQGGGKIINIASMASWLGGTTVPAYAACKHAVAGLTKALSNDWGKYGISVNAIAPGYMATSLNTALIGNPDREPMILARIPMKRWGVPEDMMGAVVFLASHASDYMGGAVIPVDGGYLHW